MVRLVDGLGVACCAPIGMQHATNAGILQQPAQQRRNSAGPLRSAEGIGNAQQSTQQGRNRGATNAPVFDAPLLRDAEPVASLAAPSRAVVEYGLTDGKGGTLIDPAGPVSAVQELRWRFGDRVDWPALLRAFEALEQDADREAASLIRKLMADDYRTTRGE
jgi:hypothetical protein